MWFGDTVEIVFIMVGGGCVCESKGFSSCWHVPQSILNSTSLLSDMLWQMLSSFELYIYGPKRKYSILLAWYGEDGRIEQAYCLSGGVWVLDLFLFLLLSALLVSSFCLNLGPFILFLSLPLFGVVCFIYTWQVFQNINTPRIFGT